MLNPLQTKIHWVLIAFDGARALEAPPVGLCACVVLFLCYSMTHAVYSHPAPLSLAWLGASCCAPGAEIYRGLPQSQVWSVSKLYGTSLTSNPPCNYLAQAQLIVVLRVEGEFGLFSEAPIRMFDRPQARNFEGGAAVSA